MQIVISCVVTDRKLKLCMIYIHMIIVVQLYPALRHHDFRNSQLLDVKFCMY